jgi:hypothetical protein
LGEHVFVHFTNHKGNVAELAVAAELVGAGLSVLKPLTEHERYDLAIEIGGRFLRIQVKHAMLDGNVVRVHLSRSRRGPNGLISHRYTRDEIDAIGAYCSELKHCYLIPFDDVGGSMDDSDAPLAAKERPEGGAKLRDSLPLTWGCSSVGRAGGWHPPGRGFESPQLH